MPDDYRIKQFFNKGLFDSLLTHNGGNAAKNLIYATKAGYIDNNIKVTLNTIFPVNSVIYIGKNPYAIGDVQWTSGNWILNVKHNNDGIETNKINNSQSSNKLVKEEIIADKKLLYKFPNLVRFGNNYIGAFVGNTQQKMPNAASTNDSSSLSSSTTQEVSSNDSSSSSLSSSTTQEVSSNGTTRENMQLISTSSHNDLPLESMTNINPREQEILDNYIHELSLNFPKRDDPNFWRRQSFIDFFIKPKFTIIVNMIFKNLAENNTELMNAKRHGKETLIQEKIKHFYL